MPRPVQYLFGVGIAALLVVVPAGYAWFWHTHIRNFHVVREDVLYRSGQLTPWGLKHVVRDYDIKTVITLRDATIAGQPPPDLEEEEWCNDQEINYYRIPPRSWWARDGSIPATRGIKKFRQIMDDPANYPVLIHCFGGIHRTGAFCAVYRMEYEHWSNQEAIDELRACGYDNLDDEWDVLTFLENYRPLWRESAARAERTFGKGPFQTAKRVKHKAKHPRPQVQSRGE